jgi:hypothetical protein
MRRLVEDANAAGQWAAQIAERLDPVLLAEQIGHASASWASLRATRKNDRKA